VPKAKGENKMKLREKTTVTLLIAILMISTLAVIIPVMAKEQIAVEMKQTQFQWRTWKTPAQWSNIWYDGVWDPMEAEYSGNVLHTEISYQPDVLDEVGTSQVYVYNKKTEQWIMREGTIQYKSPYGPQLWITEYWKGYLEFDGEPSSESFVHGVQYQWGYVFGYDENNPPPYYTYAVWDETMDAWLLGFSIYLLDPIGTEQKVAYKETCHSQILS